MTTKPFRASRFLTLTAALVLLGRVGLADYTVGFDDLTLAANSAHVNGSFQSGGLGFNNTYNSTYGSWGGFAYSNSRQATPAGYPNITTAVTLDGRGPGADNYGVGTGYSDATPTTLIGMRSLPTITLAAGTSLAGLFVTNTTYGYDSISNGDQFAKKFGGASGNDADFFELIAYGTDALGRILGNSVAFYLADYRFANNALDYVVKDWRYMDLSSLAGATEIHFNMTSSDIGRYGMNTPAFFAIDDLVVVSPQAVPEPSSLALAAVGVAGVLLASRRKNGRPSDN